MNFSSWKAACSFALVASMLSGCATTQVPAPAEVLSDTQLQDALKSDGIRMPSGTSVKFVEKTKTKVAGGTALVLVTGLLGGGFGGTFRSGPRNTMPTTGYADLDANSSVFTADEVESFQAPAEAMAAAVSKQLQAQGVRIDPGSRFTVQSSGSVWGMDYDKMGEKDNYRLYYSIQTTLRQNNAVVRYDTCEGTTKAAKSLDAWMAGDRVEIRRAAASIGDLCADNLLAHLTMTERAAMTSAAPSTEQQAQ